ncbi:Nucleotidyltransferase [Gloeophyllum trabeum ATCC 11539]|uniref:polynucleotide adenylyltransferase n=1 Tax=Gloeophyllum trabeum (strain ATCC 11539 / FP-39264 / Madison 617) TaxID=670483 RepID=S7QLF9_GLOTA|nr:Nucleotidyltransferase [Gloeophyllum trabeum ATCC 11539]EPQ60182.1 Nucleotidyltransferase [Gloeophyllum trabeum ATCC 11539]
MASTSMPLPDFIPLDDGVSHRAPPKHKLPDKPATETARKKRRRTSAEPGSFDDHSHTPWIDALGITEYESKEQRLHDEIVAFVKYVDPTPQETSARKLVIGRISEIVRERFRNSRVEVFGSIAQNLCLPDSIPGDKKEANRALFQLRNRFKDAGISEDAFVVSRARVPIINMSTTPAFGRSCKIDLSVNNNTGLHVIEVLKGYLEKMPALRPLILVLKGFLTQRKLNSAADAGLGSFALISMIISFLQLNPSKLPRDIIDQPIQNESLGRLLLDFFYYYGYTFPYRTSYISVTDAKLDLKETKGWFRTESPEALSIQSMIDPDRDIGSGTTRIEAIRVAFRQAFNTLNNFPFTISSANVLGNVLGFSGKTIAQREHLRQMIDSGALQRAIKPPNASRSRYPPRGSRGRSPAYAPRDYLAPPPQADYGHRPYYGPPSPAYDDYYRYPPPQYGPELPPHPYGDYGYNSRPSHTVSRDDYRRNRRQR